jgi:hypothetical protein
MVLQRFLCNKDQPRIGHLVTSLLCSPAEAKVYEKEQTFLRLHGNKGIDMSWSLPTQMWRPK